MRSPMAVLPMPYSPWLIAESARLSVAFMANSVGDKLLTLSVKVVGVSRVFVSWLRSLTETRPTSTVEAANAGEKLPIRQQAIRVFIGVFMTEMLLAD